MIRTSITLALVVIATAVPVAQAGHYGPLDPPIAAAIQTHRLDYGPLDPPIAAAIQTHRLDYGPLDPPIAAAIQTHRLDYGPLDPPIATAIRMHGSAAQPQTVAVPVDVAAFNWGDFAVGAGAMLALVLALASLRAAIFVVRSRRSEGLSA